MAAVCLIWLQLISLIISDPVPLHHLKVVFGISQSFTLFLGYALACEETMTDALHSNVWFFWHGSDFTKICGDWGPGAFFSGLAQMGDPCFSITGHPEPSVGCPEPSVGSPEPSVGSPVPSVEAACSSANHLALVNILLSSFNNATCIFHGLMLVLVSSLSTTTSVVYLLISFSKFI